MKNNDTADFVNHLIGYIAPNDLMSLKMGLPATIQLLPGAKRNVPVFSLPATVERPANFPSPDCVWEHQYTDNDSPCIHSAILRESAEEFEARMTRFDLKVIKSKKYVATSDAEITPATHVQMDVLKALAETSCGKCDYEEADGSLVGHCPECLTKIVRGLWELTHEH